jgi:hypothetical protein
MWKVWLPRHPGRRLLCDECWEAWTELPYGAVPKMRALSPEEAETAWRGCYSQVDYTPYLEDLRAMKPGLSYELSDDQGVSTVSTQRRYSYAARQAGLRLLWAPLKQNKGRLIARLAPPEAHPNGQVHTLAAAAAKGF